MAGRTWPEIEAHYARYARGSAFVGAMHRLVQQIAASRYVDGVFAGTSMFDLVLTQTRLVSVAYTPSLVISPLAQGQLEFRYLDTGVKAKQWSRIVDGANGFGRLERFFEQLHWFVNYKQPSRVLESANIL